jgi:hypothetical protein
MRDVVPCAARRQANCYYSSSDPVFADRYEGFDEYELVERGEVALEGGEGRGVREIAVHQQPRGLREG